MTAGPTLDCRKKSWAIVDSSRKVPCPLQILSTGLCLSVWRKCNKICLAKTVSLSARWRMYIWLLMIAIKYIFLKISKRIIILLLICIWYCEYVLVHDTGWYANIACHILHTMEYYIVYMEWDS